MTDEDRKPDLPGNDGRWFLEIAGVVPIEPTSTSTIATLEQPVLDAAAAKAAAAESDSVEETDEIPLSAGSAASEQALRDYRPGELSTPLASRRSFRWTMVAVATVAVLVVVAAIIWLPAAADNQATELANGYGSALTDYRNILPETQAAVIALSNPVSRDSDLGGVIPATADLQEHASSVAALAAEPLPSTLPLVSRGRLEGLGPTRSSMLVLGADGEDIAARIGRGFIYRTTPAELFASGDLPTVADSAVIDQLAVDLPAVLAEASGLASDLPEDPLFGPVKAATSAATERFATWQLEYLDALRSGDADAAAALLEELDAIQAEIGEAAAEALAALAEELNGGIIDLAGSIEETIASIPD